MPTYDYVCDACDHAFDEFQSITAKPLRKCPACGKAKLRRLIGTGGGVIFKGSGFYETDYRSESYKKSAEADKPQSAESKSESKADTKTESKSSAADAKDTSATPAVSKKSTTPKKKKND